MSYLAIYRRYRPTDFSKVVGQEHVVTTLINQIKTQRIGHAYLFSGARGTGKTTVARIFARAINCLDPQNGSPCGKCEVCTKLLNPQNLDIIEIDAASNNKVDNIQEVRTNVQYPPVAGRYKVYIIDEVHMLTTEAFNALLKTLEEPPSHAVFILATTEPQKLPATILSRCMRFDFHLVSDKVIEELIENIYISLDKDFEKEAVMLIAKSGEGSIRDALSLADLCVSYTDEKLTYKQVIDILGASDSTKTAKLIESILRSDTGECLSTIESLADLGKSISVLTKDLLKMIRDVLVVKTCKDAKSILMIPDGEFEMLKALSILGDNHRFLRLLEIFGGIESDLRYSTHPRIVFESAAIKAAMPQEDYNIDALIARIAALEKLVSSDAPISPMPQKTSSGIKGEEAPSQDQQKPAYKPVIEQNAAKDDIKQVSNSFAETEDVQNSEALVNEAKAVDNKDVDEVRVNLESDIKEPAFKKTEERLSGFDYIPDEPPAFNEPYTPPENQMSFDTFELSYGNVVINGGEETQPAQNNGVIRDRVPDARLWGTMIRKLRSEKHIMLWIACQELDAKIEGDNLVIICDGDTEYGLLSKKESIQTLQSILDKLAPYKIKVKLAGDEQNNEDEFLKDAQMVNHQFDDKLIIK